MSGTRARERVVPAPQGFSLVEVLVAVALLGIVVSSLAALSYNVAQRSVDVSSLSHRSGTVVQHLNRLLVLPFDSLPSRAGCSTVSTGSYPHTRCVSVTDVSTTVRQVKLIVTPTSASLKPDTVEFKRSKTADNPFN